MWHVAQMNVGTVLYPTDDPRIAEIDGIRIIPGMPTQVFIKTGHGTVALYALRPLLDSFNNAFHED